SLDMAIDFVIEAFAVVVIGGLGSMRGGFSGALIVGLLCAFALVGFSPGAGLAVFVLGVAGVLLGAARPFGWEGSVRARPSRLPCSLAQSAWRCCRSWRPRITRA